MNGLPRLHDSKFHVQRFSPAHHLLQLDEVLHGDHGKPSDEGRGCYLVLIV